MQKFVLGDFFSYFKKLVHQAINKQHLKKDLGRIQGFRSSPRRPQLGDCWSSSRSNSQTVELDSSQPNVGQVWCPFRDSEILFSDIY